MSKSFSKRDDLRNIEVKYQQLWEKENVYEQDFKDVKEKDKYFLTFPYPYMNGRLHLGHAFSLTKAEFMARYQRMKGKHVLFPFAYHCTGQPICAAANKLKRELNESEVTPHEDDKKGEKKKEPVRQYNVLSQMGISAEEIPQFVDPLFWLEYFPPHAQSDLKKFGTAIDHRRSFITTEKNPYYDQFIRWQFEHLKAKNIIQFGNRNSIFSPLDDQPCADHDRSVGEGVKPKDYTIVKLEALKPLPKVLEPFEKFNIYFGAATLRPETMYGQTNCWLQPDGKYGLFRLNETDCYVMTHRAAKNLAYQNISYEPRKVTCLAEFSGQDLFGTALKAPYAIYDKIYVLPMFGVDCKKTTGVVTSVPADSPDDYAAYRDLQQKPLLREKFGIKEEWVQYPLVEIIEIKDVGKLSAVHFCDLYNVTSQNSREELAKAHADAYKFGFSQGVLLKGKHAGTPVKVAKDLIKQELMDQNLAIPYAEPEELVISRSGDECVVAKTDQWYINYGQEDWKNALSEYLETEFKYYNEQTYNELRTTVDWLEQWTCSREFGLGTKLPCDERYLIESLSDSTIYMAYYTIAHLLQGGSLNGSTAGPLNITPDQLTVKVFDYIFLEGDFPKDTTIPKESLDQLRSEFQYWYPVDLRVSAKDLIKNHLTMFLYNHEAMWGKKYMPRSIYCNGYVMVNGDKMSKSLGNFLTLTDIIDQYGVDASRFALADAGDTHQDANFETAVANSGILKLYTFIQLAKRVYETNDFNRTGEFGYFDKKYESLMQDLVNESVEHFDEMRYKEVLNSAYVMFSKIQHQYITECDSVGISPHSDLMKKSIHTQCRLLAPICPHVMDHVWREILKEKGSVIDAAFPAVSVVDPKYVSEQEYFQNIFQQFTRQFEKSKASWAKKKVSPNTLIVYVATEYSDWQKTALKCLRDSYEQLDCFDKEFVSKTVKTEVPNKKQRNLVMGFINQKAKDVEATQPRNLAAIQEKLQYDGVAILTTYAPFVGKTLGLTVKVYNSSDNDAPDYGKKKGRAVPGFPSFTFEELK